MTGARTAIVAGGGIAGAATAIALQKAGIEAVVYEAHRDSAEGIGAFLTLGSNGIDALRTLDAAHVAMDLGFPTPGIALRNSAGKLLGYSSTGLPLRDGTVSRTLRRADLYVGLNREAAARGIRIEYGKRLVQTEQIGTEVRARFADGTEAIADVLIGADGVHSTVRGIIDPAAPNPVYSGLLTTGGYAQHAGITVTDGSYEMIFGRRGFFGYATALDGVTWWFANVPHRRELDRRTVAAETEHERRARLNELFADDRGPALSLIEASPEIGALTAIHTVPKLRHWHRGRIVVIGDAAHAPSPTSGQGASLSIEDAVVLAQCLRDNHNVPAALARFEAERKPRVQAIVRWAARVNSSKAAGPVAAAIRDAMMPHLLRMTVRSKAFGDIYHHHIHWDDRQAAR
ncbi:FAD-dependent monooxygenase [Nocardia sp. NPDC051900]|uniref:FAD-dependent monooxygenase n=1 Tax=Nocardia sp. NPDC051900 TaxID=3364326 RepID=UPI0037AD8035